MKTPTQQWPGDPTGKKHRKLAKLLEQPPRRMKLHPESIGESLAAKHEPQTQHTPGEWKIWPKEGKFANQTVIKKFHEGYTPYWENICAMPIGHNEANAKLIAAAPDLLATLKNCEMKMCDMGEWLKAYADPKQALSVTILAEDARAAITKATG